MPKKTKRIKHTDKSKPWNIRTSSSKNYQVESREIKKIFLIICEGKNTEPEYFKSFPLSNAKVESYGFGTTKTTLVEYVLEIIKESPDKDREVWVVFDMDLKESQKEKQFEDFNKAVDLASNNDINVAYSNDAFELWLVLHYRFIDSQLLRFQFYEILSKLWDLNYERKGKNLVFCRTIYEILENDNRASQARAIEFAKKLDLLHEGSTNAEKNPYTSIHLLVSELNKYIN